MTFFADFAYRCLRDDEIFETELRAPNPYGQHGIAYHVNHGSKKNYAKTQFISASWSVDKLKKFLKKNPKDDIRTVIINVSYCQELRIPVHPLHALDKDEEEVYGKMDNFRLLNKMKSVGEVLFERIVPNACFMKFYVGSKDGFADMT